MNVSRRQWLQGAALISASLLGGCATLRRRSHSAARVVIVGGGFGGATAAKQLRLLDSTLDITLIEPKSHYITCPGSNWLLAGLTDLGTLTLDYQVLRERHAIEIINDHVTHIEADQRELVLASGQRVAYQRLILSPGIDFRWEAIDGYDAQVAQRFPHAWQAGSQTLTLAQQLQTLTPGGVVLMSIPADPYRCPPGPYERASLMAWWLKQHNPRAKIILLDHKRSFSKQALFETLWNRHYGFGTARSLIEWHSLADNPVQTFDAGRKTLITEFGDHFSGDIINIIPPQRAAAWLEGTGLTDASGWCPIQPSTSQSLLHPDIHVIGDAAQFAPLPKSAFAANSEAKACALAVFALLNDRPPESPVWLNTCYSLVTPEQGISVAGVYQLDQAQRISGIAGAGGVSPSLSEESLRLEARYAKSAYRQLLANSFG